MRDLYPTRVYDGVINEQLVAHISKQNAGLFKYGWKGNSKLEGDQGHWNVKIAHEGRHSTKDLSCELFKLNSEIGALWEYIQRYFVGNKALHQCYINGYTFGTDGYIHRDDPWAKEQGENSPTCETVIIYLNEQWDANWGGETALFDQDREIVKSVLPKFGRVLIFDGQTFHASRPMSRMCPKLRQVLVFKTFRMPEHNKTPNAVDVAYNITKGMKHSGRSFFEHLINTSVLLLKEGAKEDVVAAGLFHSIYGTEQYKIDGTLITPEQLKNVISPYSFKLVQTFCSLEHRRSYFLALANNFAITQQQHDLIQIQMCNLIEQRPKHSDIPVLRDMLKKVKTNE